MNQSEFLAITCHLFEAREKSRVQGVIGFGLLLIGWKADDRFEANHITKSNYHNRVVFWTVIWKLL